MAASSLLNFSISCSRTVVREGSRLLFDLNRSLSPFCRSRSSGTLPRIRLLYSRTNSSGDIPPPEEPEILGCMERILSSMF